MVFYQTLLEAVSPLNPVYCREDQICTIPAIEGGNICFMDDGSPLYILQCGTMEPLCLYGVASTYRSYFKSNRDNYCNGGSYFASVVYFDEWINEIVTWYM